MRICTVDLISASPYSASKFVDPEQFPFLSKESHDARDKRLWREKATTNEQGNVCIPQMGLKMAVDEAIKRLGISIPGKRAATYTKYFLAGQLCERDVDLGIHKDELAYVDVWANLDGVRGSGKRGMRRFPIVKTWTGTASFLVLDDIIPKEIFEKTIVEAGRLIGVGRFRPEKGGFMGRFSVENFRWFDQ